MSAYYAFANGASAHFESLPSEMPADRTDSWFGFEAYGTRGIISVRNSPKGNMFVYPYGQWVPGNDDEKWEPVVLDEWGLHENVPVRSSMHLSNRMIVAEADPGPSKRGETWCPAPATRTPGPRWR